MKKLYFALAAIVPALLFFAFSRSSNSLEECWKLQVKPLEKSFLEMHFQETFHELHHSFYPWEQTAYKSTGRVSFGTDRLLKADTITNFKFRPSSLLDYSASETLLQDFGDDSLSPVTQTLHEEQLLQLARYTPGLLIDYFRDHKSQPVKSENPAHNSYQAAVYGTLVQLSIGKELPLVQEVTWLSHHEQFGDARTTITYQSYQLENGVYTPRQIIISKINGKLMDTVNIAAVKPLATLPVLLKRPPSYEMKEVTPVPESVTVSHYNDHIHFVEFQQADARSLVVEFNDFLFVAEAPLSSENGELLIREAQKIAPEKPIKYFAFGHYHPHYLGGVRPFVHKRATILTVASDQEFVRYIAQAPRSLHPDSLFLQPVPLTTEVVGDKKIISDGNYSMEIHFIGERSEHTNDYLVYYFPEEKLLFEDDLAWIPKQGPVKKAGGRQQGLYAAVKDIGLQVDTVVQGWPLNKYDVKTRFSFAELEESVNME